MVDESPNPPEQNGITDEDLARIEAYLALHPADRTPDRLRPDE